MFSLIRTAQKVQTIEQSKTDIDGRKIWGILESKVTKIELEEMNYNNSLRNIYNEMNDIIIKYNMNSSEFDPKFYHFFMQLKNLVETKSNFILKINRIMQLAYNAGQLSVFLDNIDKQEKKYQEALDDIKKIVDKYNMKELDTYVSNANQEKINTYIKDIIIEDIKKELDGVLLKSQEGGNNNDLDIFRQKYLKYKKKYLELKQNII